MPLSQLKRPRPGDSLQKIIDDYDIERFFCWGQLLELETILDFICGKAGNPVKIYEDGRKRYARCRHQARLKNSAIEEAEKKLQKIKGELEECNDFEELHHKVKKISVKGFGNLATYDFCLRFGWKKGIYPQKFVYLHAGTKEGAKELKRLLPELNSKEYEDRLPIGLLPKNIQDLGAIHIENLMCIFKSRLANLQKI